MSYTITPEERRTWRNEHANWTGRDSDLVVRVRLLEALEITEALLDSSCQETRANSPAVYQACTEIIPELKAKLEAAEADNVQLRAVVSELRKELRSAYADGNNRVDALTEENARLLTALEAAEAEVRKLRQQSRRLQQKCNNLSNKTITDDGLKQILDITDKAPGDFASNHEYGVLNIIGKAQSGKDLHCCIRLEDLSFFSDAKATIRRLVGEVQRLRQKEASEAENARLRLKCGESAPEGTEIYHVGPTEYVLCPSCNYEIEDPWDEPETDPDADGWHGVITCRNCSSKIEVHSQLTHFWTARLAEEAARRAVAAGEGE